MHVVPKKYIFPAFTSELLEISRISEFPHTDSTWWFIYKCLNGSYPNYIPDIVKRAFRRFPKHYSTFSPFSTH